MVGNQPLLTLLPTDAILEAHLFAPSKAVGFVEPGQHVRVRSHRRTRIRNSANMKGYRAHARIWRSALGRQ